MGSTATTVVRVASGLFACASLIAREMPVIVPPVPAPATSKLMSWLEKSEVSSAYCTSARLLL